MPGRNASKDTLPAKSSASTSPCSTQKVNRLPVGRPLPYERPLKKGNSRTRAGGCERTAAGSGRAWVIDPLRDDAGKLVGFAKITRDITDRKVAQEALDKSEQQFELLVQGVTDYAIYMLSPTGEVTNWNAGAERIKRPVQKARSVRLKMFQQTSAQASFKKAS